MAGFFKDSMAQGVGAAIGAGIVTAIPVIWGALTNVPGPVVFASAAVTFAAVYWLYGSITGRFNPIIITAPRAGPAGLPDAIAEIRASSGAASEPGKFYSQGDKNRIGDRLFELTELFRKERNAIAEAMRLFMGDWQAQMAFVRQGKKPDAGLLQKRLQAVLAETITINKAMYDEDGFLKGPYHEVMREIIQLDRTPRD